MIQSNTNIINTKVDSNAQVKINRQSVKKVNNLKTVCGKEGFQKKYDYSCDLFLVLVTLIDACIKEILPSNIIMINGIPKISTVVRSDLYFKLYETTGFRYYKNEAEMTQACYQMLFKINNGHTYRYSIKNELIKYVSKCLEYFPTRTITIDENEVRKEKVEKKEKKKQVSSSILCVKRKEYVSETVAKTFLDSINDDMNNFIQSLELWKEEETLSLN